MKKSSKTKRASKIKKSDMILILRKQLSNLTDIVAQLSKGYMIAVNVLENRTSEIFSLRGVVGDAVIMEIHQQLQMKEVPMTNEQKYTRLLSAIEKAFEEQEQAKHLLLKNDTIMKDLKDIEVQINEQLGNTLFNRE